MLAISSPKKILWMGLAVILAAAPLPGWASASALNPMNIEGPVAPSYGILAADQLPLIDTGALDIHALRSEEAVGEAPQFADPVTTLITPESHGVWVNLDARFQLWQLRVTASGALSMNFGFTDFELPKGARLTIYPTDLIDADDKRGVRVFTEMDNRDPR